MKKSGFNIWTNPGWVAGSILAIIVFGLCLVPAFIKAGYGACPFDEPYQITNGLNYRSVPLAPLSAWLTYFFGNLFDWRWISFRYLAISLNALSIFIAGIYLLVCSRRYWTFLCITAVSLLAGTLFPESHNLYGWDAWTGFTLLFCIIACLSYMRHPSLGTIIYLGILSGITALTRLPNGIIMPLILCFLWVFNPDRQIDSSIRWKYSVVYTVSFIITFIVVLTLLFGSVTAFISAIRENSVDSHNSFIIIYKYVNNVSMQIPVILMLWGIFLIIRRVLNSRYRLWVLPAAILSAWVVYYNTLISHNIGFGCVTLVYVALISLGLFTIIYTHRKFLREGSGAAAIMLLVLALVPTLGSNTGVGKMLAWSIAPIVWLYLIPQETKAYRYLVGIAVAAILAYSYNGLRANSFFDVGLTDGRYTFSGGILDGIKTSPEAGERIQGVVDAFSDYNSDDCNVIVLRGDKFDYLYEYVFLKRNDFIGSRFEFNNFDNDPEYTAWVESRIMQGDKPANVLYVKPSDGSMPDSSMMLQMLDSHLRRASESDSYIIFTAGNN